MSTPHYLILDSAAVASASPSQIQFRLRLIFAAAPTRPITVCYATFDLIGGLPPDQLAKAGVDYYEESGTATFDPASVTPPEADMTIGVPVPGMAPGATPKVFGLKLYSPKGATILRAEAGGVICPPPA